MHWIMSDEQTTTPTDPGQLGWIVSWKVPSEVPLSALRDALRTAGMDTDLAGDMSTQNALRRALRDMNESRVIRKLRHDGDTVFFQITHEEKTDTKIEYWREAEVCLEGCGNVTCDVPELAEQARILLTEHLSKRLTTDLTRLLKAVFDKRKADLVPIREQGGAYFVPEHCQELVDQSRALLNAIGGKLRSFAVRLGCGDTKASVAESLSQYLADLVGEFRESIDGIDASKGYLIERRAGRVAELRQKLSTYRGLLSGYADVIASDIDAADKQLAAAIAGVPQEPKEPEPTLVEEFERLKAQGPRDLFDQSAQEQEAAAKSFPALAGREIWASPSTPSDPAIASLILRRRIN